MKFQVSSLKIRFICVLYLKIIKNNKNEIIKAHFTHYHINNCNFL